MKIQHTANYAALRARAYPNVATALDALVQKELGNPQPWKDYVAACAAVKARFPKPAKG